jgi:hypothetical protein
MRQNCCHVTADDIVFLLNIIILIFFKLFVDFPDIANEFNDSFKVVVIDAVFALVLVFKSVIVFKK